MVPPILLASPASAATAPPARRPVRVVHIIPIDGIGGVEVAARSALSSVAAMVFALAPIAGTAVGMPGEVLPPRYRSPDDPRAVTDTVRRILCFRPDVVVGSLWRSVPVLLALKVMRPRLRLVFFLHSDRTVHRLDWAWSRIGVVLADALWCDSMATLQGRLTVRQQRRGRVISFITDRSHPPPPLPPAPLFTIWARLHHFKGLDRAVLLVALLVRRGIDAHFCIYGPDAGERQALEAQVRDAGLAPNVSLQGPIGSDDRYRLAAEATFFLQLSRVEGMAMSVVEAMQLGLVPVVTAVGEIGNYVEDGVNGVIVDPDQLGEAADRLSALLADPPRIMAMREAAIATWQGASLYRDDIAQAASELAWDG